MYQSSKIQAVDMCLASDGDLRVFVVESLCTQESCKRLLVLRMVFVVPASLGPREAGVLSLKVVKRNVPRILFSPVSVTPTVQF